MIRLRGGGEKFLRIDILDWLMFVNFLKRASSFRTKIEILKDQKLDFASICKGNKKSSSQVKTDVLELSAKFDELMKI